MKAHDAEADRALAQRRSTWRASMPSGASSMKLVSTLSSMRSTSSMKPRLVAPLVPGLDIQRRQAADRGAFLAVMIDAGRQGDLAAQVRGRDLQAQLALMLGQRAVHRVDEQQIGLAGLQARFQDALPQLARIDLAQHLAGPSGCAARTSAVLHRVHEFVGDVDAVMQVQALAVEVARRPCGSPGTPRSPDGGCRDRPPPNRGAASPGEMASVSPSITWMNGMMPRGLAAPSPFRRWSGPCPNRCRCRRHCEASATFSFQVPTMPSSESDTSLRKQEIGRPRLVPPLDRIGVAGMNHSRDSCSRRAAARARRRRHRRRRRARTCPGSFRPASR